MKKKDLKRITKYRSIVTITLTSLATLLTLLFSWKDNLLSSESIALQKREINEDRFMLSIIPKKDNRQTKFIRPFSLKKLTEEQFETIEDKKRFLFYPMIQMSCENDELELSQYDSLSYSKKSYFFELENGYLEDFKITKSYSVRQINAFTDGGFQKRVTIPLHDLLMFEYTGKQTEKVIEVTPNTVYLEVFSKCLINSLKTENFKHFASLDYNLIEVKLGDKFKHYRLDKGIMISQKEFSDFANIYNSYGDINPIKLNNIMNPDYMYNWYDQNKKLITTKKEIPIVPGGSYILETCSTNRDSIMSLIKIIDSKGNLANTLKF